MFSFHLNATGLVYSNFEDVLMGPQNLMPCGTIEEEENEVTETRTPEEGHGCWMDTHTYGSDDRTRLILTVSVCLFL